MLIGYDPYSGTMQHFDTKGIIQEVARCGYDAINLPMRPDFVDAENEEPLQSLEGMLRDAGLKTPSIGIAPHIWTTPGQEEETQRHLDIAVQMAKRFGAQLLTMWPNLPEGVNKEDGLKTFAENMKAGVPKADAAGYPIAFEFEKGCTIDNYREAVEFIQSTDPRIRIVADTYHINNDQADPYEAAIAMKGLLGEIHISGSDRGEPGSDTDEFDYDAFVRGVKEIGFDGPVMLQYKLEDPASIGRACEFTRKLFDL
ncbi:MAG: sugar phosphate isomerase/epimerase [Planctomycetes bacterium]|nr:sugar phosphate isomerase/epimerase [Planctomycetota bacterium]